MPIFEYLCNDCGKTCEIVVFRSTDQSACPNCGSANLTKVLSATSPLSGNTGKSLPGRGDTACCGSAPGMASGCAGPGSCCGKMAG